MEGELEAKVDGRQALGNQCIGAVGTLKDTMRVPLGPSWRKSGFPRCDHRMGL